MHVRRNHSERLSRAEQSSSFLLSPSQPFFIDDSTVLPPLHHQEMNRHGTTSIDQLDVPIYLSCASDSRSAWILRENLYD